jgi:hypothetical protein
MEFQRQQTVRLTVKRKQARVCIILIRNLFSSVIFITVFKCGPFLVAYSLQLIDYSVWEVSATDRRKRHQTLNESAIQLEFNEQP